MLIFSTGSPRSQFQRFLYDGPRDLFLAEMPVRSSGQDMIFKFFVESIAYGRHLVRQYGRFAVICDGFRRAYRSAVHTCHAFFPFRHPYAFVRFLQHCERTDCDARHTFDTNILVDFYHFDYNLHLCAKTAESAANALLSEPSVFNNYHNSQSTGLRQFVFSFFLILLLTVAYTFNYNDVMENS